MKTLQSLFLGWMAFIAVFSPAPLLPQSDNSAAQKKLEAQKKAVVKLRVHRDGQSDETAAGLFVGRDKTDAYFITALHAVKADLNPNSENEELVQSVQLQFSTTLTEFPASPTGRYDAGLDLAVVRTAAANLPPDLPLIVAKDVTAGISIYICGHPSGGTWSLWPGHVQNKNAPDGDTDHFITTRDGSLVEGYSGGPVFDSQGSFLGMHLETITSYGRSAKSSVIAAKLDDWHVPTDNWASAADIDAIGKVIDGYVDAYNRKDAKALWEIWPNPDPKTKKGIEVSFGAARSITMKLSDRQIDPAGSATAQYTQEYVPKNGPALKSNDRITFKLVKKNGVWSISSVN